MPVAETLSLMVIAPLPPPWIYMAFAPLPSVPMEPSVWLMVTPVMLLAEWMPWAEACVVEMVP